MRKQKEDLCGSKEAPSASSQKGPDKTETPKTPLSKNAGMVLGEYAFGRVS